jgi:hypothetical protein
VVVHRCPHSIQSTVEAFTSGAVYTLIVALCITFVAVSVTLCASPLLSSVRLVLHVTSNKCFMLQCSYKHVTAEESNH